MSFTISTWLGVTRSILTRSIATRSTLMRSTCHEINSHEINLPKHLCFLRTEPCWRCSDNTFGQEHDACRVPLRSNSHDSSPSSSLHSLFHSTVLAQDSKVDKKNLLYCFHSLLRNIYNWSQKPWNLSNLALMTCFQIWLLVYIL